MKKVLEFTDGNGVKHSEGVVEVSLKGPYDYLPYIRVNREDGSYKDYPKHTTLEVIYGPEKSA